jgi:hypothetical protein
MNSANMQFVGQTHLKAPLSASQDPASLLRDVMLFQRMIPIPNGYFDFHNHVRSYYPVMINSAANQLEDTMYKQSLDLQISQKLGIRLNYLNGQDTKASLQLLNKSPWLAGYLELYKAQSLTSKAHFSAVVKYLVIPKMKRDVVNDLREQMMIVSNTHGNSGMDPAGILKWLNRARSTHPIVAVASIHSIRCQCREVIEKISPSAFSYPPPRLAQLLNDNPQSIGVRIWVGDIDSLCKHRD